MTWSLDTGSLDAAGAVDQGPARNERDGQARDHRSADGTGNAGVGWVGVRRRGEVQLQL